MKPVFHHYVSRFYLKQFSAFPDNDRDIYRYDKKYPGGRMASSGKSAGLDNFNRISWEENPTVVEEEYNKLIESPSVKPFRETLTNKRFASEEDLHAILMFLALTTTRNPAERACAEAPMRQLDNIVLASALGGKEADPLIQKMKEEPYPTSKHVEMEIELIDPIYHALTEKVWSLHQKAEGVGDFITSDYPLIILHADCPRPWGLASPNSVLYAPISSDLVMLGTSSPLQKAALLSEADVAALNGAIFRNAHRYTFSRSSDFPIDLLDGKGVRQGLA